MDAQETDRNAALEDFCKKIREHTIADLKGIASDYVSSRLRSKDVFPIWKSELSRIISTGGPLSPAAHRIAPELKRLKTKYNAMTFDVSGINTMITEEFGPMPSGCGFDVIVALALCRIHKRLRELETKLGGINGSESRNHN